MCIRDRSITTEFVGYDHLEYTSEITVLAAENELSQSIEEGQEGTVFVKETPFYATMGGQEGDTGVITTEHGEFAVKDTIKLLGGKVGHVGTMTKGCFKVGDTVNLSVDIKGRNNTSKNHSATQMCIRDRVCSKERILF